MSFKTIFAIETSCDETACAIVENGTTEVSSSLATSRELHEKTGGVVPEVASRKQADFMLPVISDCLEKAKAFYKADSLEEVVNHIDAVAVTVGPGLSGSLIVGLEAAKALSLAWNKPLIPVNHLIGHIYGNFIGKPEAFGKEIFPSLVLVVSGGHTDLVLMKDHNNFEYIGGTLDDAAGECFDKAARLLGIAPYLGGLKLSQLARTCEMNTIKGKLPRPMMHDDNYDFSFSGLKTAVRRFYEKNPTIPINVISYEFEQAVVDVLVEKTLRAALRNEAKSVMLAGGVSANSELRARVSEKSTVPVYFPELRLCTDNAIYIASAAYYNQVPKNINNVDVNPGLSVMDVI